MRRHLAISSLFSARPATPTRTATRRSTITRLCSRQWAKTEADTGATLQALMRAVGLDPR
jgi:hypothetical protein